MDHSRAVLGRGLITDGCDSVSSTNRHASIDRDCSQRPPEVGPCCPVSTVCSLAAPGFGVAVPRRIRHTGLRSDGEASRIACTGLLRHEPVATGAACSVHALASMASKDAVAVGERLDDVRPQPLHDLLGLCDGKLPKPGRSPAQTNYHLLPCCLRLLGCGLIQHYIHRYPVALNRSGCQLPDSVLILRLIPRSPLG